LAQTDFSSVQQAQIPFDLIILAYDCQSRFGTKWLQFASAALKVDSKNISIRPPEKEEIAMKTWMITGATRGFGAAVAREALSRADRVAVTGRNRSECEKIAADYGDAALAVQLDMLDPSAIESAVQQVEEWGGPIDVLFNNAGRGQHGAVEEVSDDEAKALFELNVFSLLDITRRVLPGMRAAGRGHIINVGSVAGLAGNPGSGLYSATKFAIEGISEALAGEVDPHGIKVTVLEPGPFRTDFNGSSIRKAETEIDAYAETAHVRAAKLRSGSGAQAGDPEKLARLVCDIAGSENPPLHLLAGNAAVDRARAKLAELIAEIDRWENTSRSLDY
jgi:short-subunit dehydrogenase